MREKTGGRTKGTPNKLTKEIRQTLKNALADQMEEIPKLLSELPNEKRLEFLIKVMPYVLPKIESVSLDEGEPGIWDFDS
jgi:hypothetical protein